MTGTSETKVETGAETGAAPAAEVPKLIPGSVAELKRYDHRYNKRGEQVRVEYLGKEDDEGDEVVAQAMVFNRYYDQQNQLSDMIVDIHSPHILTALSQVVEYYPQVPTSLLDAPLKINYPYKILYFHWDELVKIRDKAEEEVKKDHMEVLIKFMERELGDIRKRVKALLNSGHITFPLLWTLFKPGELIVSEEGDEQRLYRLESQAYAKNCQNPHLVLQLSYTYYNGTETGRATGPGKVFAGELDEIRQLDFYPLSLAENKEQLVEAMTKRGEKYLELRGMHIKAYEGLAQHILGDTYYSNEPFRKIRMKGKIAVDAKTFVEENAQYTTPKLSFKDTTDKADPNQQDSYDYYDEYSYSYGNDSTNNDVKEQFNTFDHKKRFWPMIDPMLCPPTVYGFSFSIRKWCKFFVNRVSEPSWVDNAFDRLILPDAPKQVIRALVSSHEYPTDGARDQQELKGKGCVMLLHGSPGTGKTFTAETVSEFTKRPLLVITSGELGSSSYDIDTKLKNHLRFATFWKAIILIDEADVFLEARDSGKGSNLEHNSIVAVFLRQLEYFQGVVFLTTNRRDNLDIAIKSRIHLFLSFSQPEKDVRKALWKQCLGKLDPSMVAIDFEDAFESVKDLDMNGREITNAVNTIHTLAREANTKITEKEFAVFKQVWDCFSNVEEPGKGKIEQDGGRIRRVDSIGLNGVNCEHCGCQCQK